jgi:hypothetical protein
MIASISFATVLIVLDSFMWILRYPASERQRLSVRLLLFCVLSWLLFHSGLNPFDTSRAQESLPVTIIAPLLDLGWWVIYGHLVALLLND